MEGARAAKISIGVCLYSILLLIFALHARRHGFRPTSYSRVFTLSLLLFSGLRVAGYLALIPCPLSFAWLLLNRAAFCAFFCGFLAVAFQWYDVAFPRPSARVNAVKGTIFGSILAVYCAVVAVAGIASQVKEGGAVAYCMEDTIAAQAEDAIYHLPQDLCAFASLLLSGILAGLALSMRSRVRRLDDPDMRLALERTLRRVLLVMVLCVASFLLRFLAFLVPLSHEGGNEAGALFPFLHQNDLAYEAVAHWATEVPPALALAFLVRGATTPAAAHMHHHSSSSQSLSLRARLLRGGSALMRFRALLSPSSSPHSPESGADSGHLPRGPKSRSSVLPRQDPSPLRRGASGPLSRYSSTAREPLLASASHSPLSGFGTVVPAEGGALAMPPAAARDAKTADGSDSEADSDEYDEQGPPAPLHAGAGAGGAVATAGATVAATAADKDQHAAAAPVPAAYAAFAVSFHDSHLTGAGALVASVESEAHHHAHNARPAFTRATEAVGAAPGAVWAGTLVALPLYAPPVEGNEGVGEWRLAVRSAPSSSWQDRLLSRPPLCSCALRAHAQAPPSTTDDQDEPATQLQGAWSALREVELAVVNGSSSAIRKEAQPRVATEPHRSASGGSRSRNFDRSRSHSTHTVGAGPAASGGGDPRVSSASALSRAPGQSRAVVRLTLVAVVPGSDAAFAARVHAAVKPLPVPGLRAVLAWSRPAPPAPLSTVAWRGYRIHTPPLYAVEAMSEAPLSLRIVDSIAILLRRELAGIEQRLEQATQELAAARAPWASEAENESSRSGDSAPGGETGVGYVVVEEDEDEEEEKEGRAGEAAAAAAAVSAVDPRLDPMPSVLRRVRSGLASPAVTFATFAACLRAAEDSDLETAHVAAMRDRVRRHKAALLGSLAAVRERVAHGPAFKASALKKSAPLQLLPTNVHEQHLVVAAPAAGDGQPPPPLARHTTITAGVPAAHALGLRHGGLLAAQLRAGVPAATALVEGRPARAPAGPGGAASIRRRGSTLSMGAASREEEVARLEARCRGEVVLSQAAAVAAVAATSTVEALLRLAPPALATELVHFWCEGPGLLVSWESLISTRGKELGMLEDLAGVSTLLPRLLLRLQPRVAREGEEACAVGADHEGAVTASRAHGGSLLVSVPVCVPRSHSAVADVLAASPPLRLAHAVLSQGIDAAQDVARYTGSVRLQRLLSTRGATTLLEYADAYVKWREGLSGPAAAALRGDWAVWDDGPGPATAVLVAAPPHVHALCSELRAAHDEAVAGHGKHVRLLACGAALARAVGGARVTMCKSAKDRTGMSVSLEQATVLQRWHAVEPADALLTAMRTHGTRRENAWKNIGRPTFAFNRFQLAMLPEAYRPPPGVCGAAAT